MFARNKLAVLLAGSVILIARSFRVVFTTGIVKSYEQPNLDVEL